jgi:hypothetical protein
MSRSRLVPVLLVLLIAASLCTPAWAAPGRSSSEIHLFNVLARLWGSLTAVWSEEGCGIDPNGGCGTGQPPTTDSGCKLDPHGGCAAAQGGAPIPPPTTDEGCMIDPNGSCTPGS